MPLILSCAALIQAVFAQPFGVLLPIAWPFAPLKQPILPTFSLVQPSVLELSSFSSNSSFDSWSTSFILPDPLTLTRLGQLS